MIGRYPDYDVLESASRWDEATRKVVETRMHRGSRALTFFDAAEEPTLRALCDVLTAQDDEPRIPVAEMVDDALGLGRLDGYQYADMPDDRECWRIVLRGLDEVARARYTARDFAALDAEAREALIGQFAAGALRGHSWEALNVKRAFAVCMRAVLSAFYSHPWAWNEIGFGGPAYPQGFMRLGPLSVREPHEKRGATDEDPVVFTSDES
jgi:Gluconate 2-dehydrogenase subunit 3